jgi:phosphoribosylanthranilate isomerase
MMPLLLKMCGLRTPTDIQQAEAAGADWLGLVFYPPSPRAVSLEQAVGLRAAAQRAQVVTLTVDADDDALSAIIQHARPALLQLHGQETPERVAAVNARFGLPVIKALGVKGEETLHDARRYADVAAYLLLDAPPPPKTLVPGGNAACFDWTILAGWTSPLPWLLAGGLTPENVSAALRSVSPNGIDVSSGIEERRGVKSAAKMQAFAHAVRKNKTLV